MPEILLAFTRIRYALLSSYPRIKTLLQQLDAQNLLLQEDFTASVLGFYHEVTKALMDKSHKSTATITEILNDLLTIMVTISSRCSPARRTNAALQPFAGSRLELLSAAKRLIRVLSKTIKIFRSVCKNDGLAIDFSICAFFGNTHYLEFLDAGLELCFIFEEVADCFPVCKEMILQALTALLQNDLEQIVLYLPEKHFVRLFGYLESALRGEFLKFDSNTESNFITEDANLNAIKATITCISKFVLRELRVREHRIIQKLASFQTAMQLLAPSIVALMVSSSLSFSYKSMTASIFSEVVFYTLLPLADLRVHCIQTALEDVISRHAAKSRQNPTRIHQLLQELFKGWTDEALVKVELVEFNQKYYKFIHTFVDEAGRTK